jgi:hypothetical protein
MPFLEAVWLWVGLTLQAAAWLILCVLILTLPLVAVYAVARVVEALIACMRRLGRRGPGSRGPGR